jgi:valyl-tRNA synthetase
MLQPYPRSQPEKIDAAAARDMAALKQWTVTARNLRSEAKAAPGERLQLYRTADPTVSDGELFEKAIVALARLSAFEKRDPLPDHPSPVAVLGEARLMLHKPVDAAAERERLGKESSRLEGEIEKARAQLAKPSFVERAPPAIVEQMRTRLAGFEATLTQIRSQLDKL